MFFLGAGDEHAEGVLAEGLEGDLLNDLPELGGGDLDLLGDGLDGLDGGDDGADGREAEVVHEGAVESVHHGAGHHDLLLIGLLFHLVGGPLGPVKSDAKCFQNFVYSVTF